MDKRLKKVQFFVEANSFEKLMIWEKYHNTISWVSDTSGFSYIVGYIKRRPINVCFEFVSINNKLVCFYYGCSELVDLKMIEDWIDSNYPIYYDGDRKARIDSMNFHHCVQFCKQDNVLVERKNKIKKLIEKITNR